MNEPRVLKNDNPYDEIAEVTLHEFILNHARMHGNRVFIVEDESGREFTYEDFANDCLKLANGLKSLGFCPGDIFLLYSYNCYELYVTLVAGFAVGGVGIAVRGQDTYYEVEHEARVRGAKWLFIQKELLPIPDTFSRGNRDLKIVAFDAKGSDTTEFDFVRQLIEKFEPLRDEDLFKPADVRETPARILESSGTTGPAKGSILSHYSLVAYYTFCDNTKSHVVLLGNPLAHFSGTIMFPSQVLTGGKLVIVKQYDNEKLADQIEKYKITHLLISPAMVTFLAKIDREVNLSSLDFVYVSGARTNPITAELFIQRYKPRKFVNWYGMTETASKICDIDLCQIGDSGTTFDSVGKVKPHALAKVMHTATGQMLPPREPGELWVKTPFKFLGYHNDAERTKATLDEDGWIHTGDIAYYDENENLYIVDRLKDLIDQKGYHFAPADLEDVLIKHDAVADACVVGIPEQDGTELAHAFVILKEDAKATGEEIKTFVNERISQIKQLHGDVHFVDQFPTTSFGKTKRNVLRENFLKGSR